MCNHRRTLRFFKLRLHCGHRNIHYYTVLHQHAICRIVVTLGVDGVQYRGTGLVVSGVMDPALVIVGKFNQRPCAWVSQAIKDSKSYINEVTHVRSSQNGPAWERRLAMDCKSWDAGLNGWAHSKEGRIDCGCKGQCIKRTRTASM